MDSLRQYCFCKVRYKQRRTITRISKLDFINRQLFCRKVSKALVTTQDKTYALASSFFRDEVIFVLGGADSKAAMCQKLANEFGYTPISTEKLMKGAVRRGSEIGRELADILADGKLVSQKYIMNLMREVRASNLFSGKFIVYDFPRTSDQVATYEGAFASPNQVLYMKTGSQDSEIMDVLQNIKNVGSFAL